MPNTATRLARDVWHAWQPPPIVRARDWIPAHIVIPEQTETGGGFDLDLFPHVAGVLDAVDDPEVRSIVLRWAARNAKTTTALACLVFFTAELPRPAMFGGPDEKRADDTITSLLYPMLEACPATRAQLLPERLRNKDFVIVGSTKIRKVFSGSPSTMAGFPAAYGVATEVAKWSRKKSAEARPIHLFKQRGKLFPFDSKYLFEGTPAARGECEITALAEAGGTQRRYRQVPCPHCGEYQRLVWGDEDPKTPGVKYAKDAKGKSDPIRAEENAWYRCVNGCRIDDADRPRMMRAGLWIAEGQKVDRRGRITGTPVCDSVHQVAFDELSSLYSLVIAGWGQLAREWVDAQGDPEAIRDFFNSTLALCWDPDRDRVDPEAAAARLKDDAAQLGVVPAWARFVTIGADVHRIADEHVFFYGVAAWGPARRGQLVDYGTIGSRSEWLDFCRTAAWPLGAATAAEALAAVRTGMDASEGLASQAIYDLADQLPGLWAVKGDASGMDEVYDLGYRRAGVTAQQLAQKRKAGLGDLLLVGQITQEWIEALIQGTTKRDDPAWFGLPPEAAADQDLIDQLLADHPKQSAQGTGRTVWQRSGANEWRDALRIAYALAWHYTRGGRLWPDPPIARGRGGTPARTPQPRPAPLTTPDGRPFLITER